MDAVKADIVEACKESIAINMSAANEKMDTIAGSLVEEINVLKEIVKAVASKSALPDVEGFMKTAMIAGEMNRMDTYKLAFSSILTATIMSPNNLIGRYVDTKENRHLVKTEFDKVLALTDICVEQIESKFVLNE